MNEMMRRMQELLAPLDRPRPARLECGAMVLDYLKQSLKTYVPPPEWPSGQTIFGVPILCPDGMAACAWKMLDQYGEVIKEGALALTFKEEDRDGTVRKEQ